jgi:hypothetical protein
MRPSGRFFGLIKNSNFTLRLWNRLIAGPRYNLSKAILSQDAYFCPAVDCPYFR